MTDSFLRLEDLVPAAPVEEPPRIPDIIDFGTWAATLAREGNPWGAQTPLKEIYDGVLQAAALPIPAPHVPSESPLATLDAALRGEDVFAVQEALVQGPQTVEAVQVPHLSEALERLLAAEILNIAGSSALPAERRVEALEKVAIALANPSQDNVRAILLALLRD